MDKGDFDQRHYMLRDLFANDMIKFCHRETAYDALTLMEKASAVVEFGDAVQIVNKMRSGIKKDVKNRLPCQKASGQSAVTVPAPASGTND